MDEWKYYEVTLKVAWGSGSGLAGDLVTRIHALSAGHAIVRVATSLPEAIRVEDARAEEVKW